MKDKRFSIRNRFYVVLVLWLFYCWWLSARYRFDFGSLTTVGRWLFCLMHVFTVWAVAQYMIKLTWRFYYFSRRLRATLADHLVILTLSLVLYVMLTFVLDFKDLLRDAFAIVD